MKMVRRGKTMEWDIHRETIKWRHKCYITYNENVKTHKHAKLHFYFTSLVTQNKYAPFIRLCRMATALNSNKHLQQFRNACVCVHVTQLH